MRNFYKRKLIRNLAALVSCGCIALLNISVAAAQDVTVSGNVTSETGEALPGVNVLVKSSSQGTVTDIDGNYSLRAPQEGTLVFSYVGYTAEEVAINGRSVIDVMLYPDIQQLSEIVVVGYGTQKRSNVTGSITSIKQEDIAEVKSANALEALQGKAAGVDITRSSGRAGSGYDILIRGERSLTASNSPLYIVDGVQYGESIDISPNDIESIEILKDAASTAIYGSRGANGVVIITTKKGTPGESRFNFNAYYGVTAPLGEIPLADRDYYLQFKNDLNWMRSWVGNHNALPRNTGYISELRQTELEGFNDGVDFDWYDHLLRNGQQQDYNLSFTGGSENLSYVTSINYFNEKGMIVQDEYDRFSLRFNLDGKISDFVSVGTSLVGSFSLQNYRSNPLGDARKLSPLVEPFDEDGAIIPYPRFPDEVVNPVITADPNFHLNERRVGNVVGTFYADFRILENLRLRSSITGDLDLERNGQFTGIFPGINGRSTAIAQKNIGTDYQLQNIFTYSLDNADHEVQVTAGNEILYNRTERYRTLGQDLSLPNSQWYALSSAGGDKVINLGDDPNVFPLAETQLVSFLGRIHYGFKDKYILEVSGRYDGASQLAPGHKWEFFPSASAAWRIIEEPFLENVGFMSDLKLRASYGVAGSQAVSAYSHLGRITSQPLYYEFGLSETAINAYRTAKMEDRTLTWEKTTSANIAIDFGLLNDRIHGSVDFYQTWTDDLLMDQSLSPHSGITTITTNIGSTENRGVEVSLNTINISTPDFTWSTDFTFFTNNEKITALNADVSQDLLNQWFVGHPVDVYYDRRKIGIWQLDEEELASEYGLTPGDIKFDDLNNDTIYNSDDRMILGTPRPDWTGGINSRITYRNFDFSFFVFARMGQMIRDEVRGYFQVDGLGNTMELDYWTPNNPTNDIPRPDPTRTRSGYHELSSLTYTDGSFVKVRDITLGYALPANVLNTLNVSKARIYLTAKNALVFSKFFSQGRWDPELEGDIEIPMPKMYAVGLNLQF